jgi:hypothetical protein
MAKGTGFPFLNQYFLHHLDQLMILKNLLHNVGMGLSIIFPVRKATLSTHLSTPLFFIISFLSFLDKRREKVWLIWVRKVSKGSKIIKITPENPALCLPAVGRGGDERCVCQRQKKN